MTRFRFVTLAALLLGLGGAAVCWWSPGRGEGGTSKEADEQLDPFSTRALPVEHAAVFRAAGVYPWSWRLGLPHSGTGLQRITLRYTGKDGPKQLLVATIPTRDEARTGTIEVFVVVHFDARTPMEADRMVSSLTCGAMTARASGDNPFKCKGSCQNVFRHQPDAADHLVELMTVTRDGEAIPLKLELALGSKAY